MKALAFRIALVACGLVVLIACAWATMAAGGEWTQGPSSGAGAGLQLNVLLNSGEGKLGWTEALKCELLNTNANHPLTVFHFEDPRYAYQVGLYDSSGKAIARTELGTNTGSLFSAVEGKARFKGNAGPFTLFLVGTNEVRTRRVKIKDGAMCPVYFRPCDLFATRQSGPFTLRFELQMLESSTNASARLLRFPAVDIPVKKP